MSFLPEMDQIDASNSGFEVDDSLSFTHAMPRLGLRYWRDLAAGRPMPNRNEIDPDKLGAAKTHLTLFSMHPKADGGIELIPRLVGRAFGVVFEGIADGPLDVVLEPQIVRRWQAMASMMVAHKAPIRVSGEVEHRDRRFMKFELLLAPLGEGTAQIKGVYMVSFFSSGS